MPNAERAIERLYEDAAVRDSLADPEAQTLLRWGEDQVMRLAETTPDDAAFDAAYDRLRSLLKSANRFVGERGQMDATARETRLSALLADGQALGAPVAASASALADTFTGDDDATALQQLLILLTPTDDATAFAAPPTPEAAPQTQPDDHDTAPPPDTASSATHEDTGPRPRWTWPWPTAPQPPATAPTDDAPPHPDTTDDDNDDTGDSFFDDETHDHWFD